MEKYDLIQALVIKIQQEELVEKDHVYLLHAVLYTVCFDEVVELFLNSNDKILRKYLISNIEKRIDDDSVDKVMLYNFLMDIMRTDGVEYRVYQRARMLIRFLYNYLPVDLKKEFYSYFFKSKYLYDIDLAISVSGGIWDSFMSKEYVLLFLDNKDVSYLEKVLEYGVQEDIVDYLELIWQSLESSKYKNEILKFLLPKYFDAFDFLKDSDPVSYLNALVKSGGANSTTVSDEVLENIIRDLGDEKKTFALWCIGRMGRWTVLKNHILSYI